MILGACHRVKRNASALQYLDGVGFQEMNYVCFSRSVVPCGSVVLPSFVLETLINPQEVGLSEYFTENL